MPQRKPKVPVIKQPRVARLLRCRRSLKSWNVLAPSSIARVRPLASPPPALAAAGCAPAPPGCGPPSRRFFSCASGVRCRAPAAPSPAPGSPHWNRHQAAQCPANPHWQRAQL
jgi:hypothetical protein